MGANTYKNITGKNIFNVYFTVVNSLYWIKGS